VTGAARQGGRDAAAAAAPAGAGPRAAPPAALVCVNLAAVVEQAAAGPGPYRVGADGAPYVPAGDGGIVLGVRLGDGVFAHAADHAAPGACLTHGDPAAACALAAQACIGNEVTVRSGAAAGARGMVAGKRGEGGRVIAAFAQPVLARLRPGDRVAVRSRGQGAAELAPGVVLRNIDPWLLARLPVAVAGRRVSVGVRAVVPGKLVGNGIGRPTPMWDLDLQLTPVTAAGYGAAGLRLGDLVAMTDIDARFNAGYRRGWASVGIVVHGGSPQPGHGPGVTVILSGPADAIVPRVEETEHDGLREGVVLDVAGTDP
jgi:hypothetical protein